MIHTNKQKNRAFQYFPLSWGWQLFIFILLFVYFAFLAAWLPLFNEEALQGLLAFEMTNTENYLVPKLQGNTHFVSPLYTWLLTGVSYVFGDFNILILRALYLFILLFFGLMVFLFHKRHLGTHTALLVSLASLSTIPVIFTFTSWGSPIVLASMLFMMYVFLLDYTVRKDFPPAILVLLYTFIFLFYLVQGIAWAFLSLVVFFLYSIYYKKGRRLLSLKSFLSFFVLLILATGYYLVMENVRAGYVSELIKTQFSDSLIGLIIHSNWVSVTNTLTSYIKAFIISLLPWLVFVPFAFIPRIREQLSRNKHLRLSGILFLVLVVISLLNFSVYQKNLLILSPFLFPILFRATKLALMDNSLKMARIYRMVLNILLFLLVIGSMVFLYLDHGENILNLYFKTSVFFILLASVFYLGYQFPRHLLLSFVFAIFLVSAFLRVFISRIVFTGQKISENQVETVFKVSERYQEKSLYLRMPVDEHPTDIHRFLFLYQLMDNEVIYHKQMMLPGALYILQPGDADYGMEQKVDEFTWSEKTWYIVTKRQKQFNIQ